MSVYVDQPPDRTMPGEKSREAVISVGMINLNGKLISGSGSVVIVNRTPAIDDVRKSFRLANPTALEIDFFSAIPIAETVTDGECDLIRLSEEIISPFPGNYGELTWHPRHYSINPRMYQYQLSSNELNFTESFPLSFCDTASCVGSALDISIEGPILEQWDYRCQHESLWALQGRFSVSTRDLKTFTHTAVRDRLGNLPFGEITSSTNTFSASTGPTDASGSAQCLGVPCAAIGENASSTVKQICESCPGCAVNPSYQYTYTVTENYRFSHTNGETAQATLEDEYVRTSVRHPCLSRITESAWKETWSVTCPAE